MPEIRAICRQAGVSDTGNKSDLIVRLKNAIMKDYSDFKKAFSDVRGRSGTLILQFKCDAFLHRLLPVSSIHSYCFCGQQLLLFTSVHRCPVFTHLVVLLFVVVDIDIYFLLNWPQFSFDFPEISHE